MNTLVHLLEGLTLVLVGLLIVQVSRCYQNFTRMERIQSEPAQKIVSPGTVSVRINISSASKTPVAPPIEETLNQEVPSLKSSVIENTPQIEATADIEEAKSNGEILNDYIGEFFADSLDSGVDELRQSLESVEDKSNSASLQVSLEHNAKRDMPEEGQECDEIIVVEGQSKLTPVILNDEPEEVDVPVLTEMAIPSEDRDDDQIITVMPPKNASGSSDDKIMSDKVVHAMLDEADLVCAS